MRRISFLCLFTFIWFGAFAQNYQLVNEDAVALFKNRKGNVFPLIPNVQGDSVRIHQVINTDDFDRFDNFEDSVDFIFSGVMHVDKAALNVALINLSQKEFLGIKDSVKTVLTSDGDTLEVSKNYGVIGFNSEYEIIGYYNENYSLGVENLRTSQVYDFKVGDEFHYFSRGVYGAGAQYTLESIMRILDKEIDDEVVYDVEIIEKTTFGNNVSYDTLYSTRIYERNEAIEQLPNVYIHVSDGLDYVVRMNVEDSVISKKVYYKTDFETGMYPESYVIGLGGAYYDYTGPVGPDNSQEVRSSNELVYYKKEGKEIGTPLVLGVTYAKAQKSVGVYPNPVSNILTVSDVELISGSISTLDGKQVIKLNTDEVDVSKLEKGVYILKVEDVNQGILTTKFVKE